MTHTPGPWKINPRASMVVESESGRTIASCGAYTSNTENTEPENQANARLIAAAPELLEALEAVSDEAIDEYHERHDEYWGGKLAKARATIAKTGGPQ